MVTKEEFLDWKSNKVTKAFMNSILAWREGVKEEILSRSVEEVPIRQGYCWALQDIMEVEFSEVQSDED